MPDRVPQNLVGDSFPKSLQYYDLRMRYATKVTERAPAEQDLGRAFGYRGRPEDLPIIIVGSGCFNQLKAGRYNRRGLLGVNPDTRMAKLSGKSVAGAYPSGGDEFDISCYRRCWKAASHFDQGRRPRPICDEDMCENPRRFLLFGRPQIGKTGAFLHLILLLWREINGQALAPTAPKPEPPTAREPVTPSQPRPEAAGPLEELVRALGRDIYKRAWPSLKAQKMSIRAFRTGRVTVHHLTGTVGLLLSDAVLVLDAVETYLTKSVCV